jgi:hypothetical protein
MNSTYQNSSVVKALKIARLPLEEAGSIYRLVGRHNISGRAPRTAKYTSLPSKSNVTAVATVRAKFSYCQPFLKDPCHHTNPWKYFAHYAGTVSSSIRGMFHT